MFDLIGLLQIVLIGLKLWGTITWSWPWVLAPLIAIGLWWGGALLLAGCYELLRGLWMFTSKRRSKSASKEFKPKDWS